MPRAGDLPPLHLRRATLRELELPLVRPFATSFGVERRRRLLLLSLEEEGGRTGWSECVAGRDPLYSSESVLTAREMLLRYLLPLLRLAGGTTPQHFLTAADAYRGHPMAKATVEMALWDLSARVLRTPLSRLLGGRSRPVPVGVSVGLQPSPQALVDQVSGYRHAGYGRIKLKVAPGKDEAYVMRVRDTFPEVPLWVDANQAYGLQDLPRLARWARRSRVQLVEQPFPEDRLVWHARLARRLRSPIRLCLDESITGPGRLEEAIALRALQVLNIKPGRVGGLGPSVELHARSVRAGIPVWCGGMLETGIGRAHNLSLATLPGFTLPSDLSASDRYYREDLVEPPFTLGPGSTMRPRPGTGIGVDPVEGRLTRWTRRRWELPLSHPARH
jgi:O-succinylbenzoate synthase